MKKVVLVGGSLTITSKKEQTIDCARAEWRGEGRELLSAKHAETYRLTWTTHKPMGWVLQGGYVYKLLPVDPPRMSRLSDSPENDADTDVQTRDCASLNRNGRLGRSQRRSDRICPKASGNLLRRDRRRRVNIGFSREKKQSCVWASRFGVDRDVYRALYCQA